MSCPCAAYFRNGEVVQSMAEHLFFGVKFIENYFLARGFQRYLARLASVSTEEAVKAVYAAFIFHDAGKLLRTFQMGRGGFQGHEFASAAMLAVSQLSLGSLKYPVILAVALHHHTLLNRASRKPKGDFCGDCIKQLVKTYVDKVGVDATVPDKIGVVSYRKLISVFRESSLGEMRIAYPLLEAVMLADNYSAGQRGDGSSLLGREILEVYKVYRRLRQAIELL